MRPQNWKHVTTVHITFKGKITKWVESFIGNNEFSCTLVSGVLYARGGEGGGVLPYVCILGTCRARDPHFQPYISVLEHIIFTNDQKIRSGASPFYIFCRSGDQHFQFFFYFNPFTASHGRLSPNAKRSAAPRVSGRPECQPDASWQFRRPAFSCLKRLKLGPEPRSRE